MEDIKQTLRGCDNESTRSPYWLILDPQQNMGCDIHYLAGQISGLFFSREDAQKYLDMRRYNFSKRAKVYCLSGYHSRKYEDLCKKIGV